MSADPYDLDAAIRHELGDPVPFADVRPGDTIRARTERGGVVEHRAGTVVSRTDRYLTGPGHITIAVIDYCPDVYLIERPAPENREVSE